MESLEQKTYMVPLCRCLSGECAGGGPCMPGEGTAQRAGCGLLAGQDWNKASTLEAWAEDRTQQ